jgi:aminoglycoside 6'-N-acetyltransferase I
MLVRHILPTDQSEWLRMRQALWPGAIAELTREVVDFFARSHPGQATFVIDRGDARLGGFLEARVRSHAEGCASTSVGYIEGWYIDPDLRQRGLGRQLVEAAEGWARALGLVEMASDCELDNEVSFRAHVALGYQEVGRIICFRKALAATPNNAAE